MAQKTILPQVFSKGFQVHFDIAVIRGPDSPTALNAHHVDLDGVLVRVEGRDLLAEEIPSQFRKDVEIRTITLYLESVLAKMLVRRTTNGNVRPPNLPCYNTGAS